MKGPLGTWTNSSEGKPDLACCRSGSAILVLQPRDRAAILGVNMLLSLTTNMAAVTSRVINSLLITLIGQLRVGNL